MKLSATLSAVCLAWSACSIAEPTSPMRIEVGKSFSLRAGMSAQTSDAALLVGFEAVTGDSRCPKGEQCVRAGDATVRLWVQEGGGPRQARELHSAPGAGNALRVAGHELRLLGLEPFPVTGRPIAAADYVAILALGPAARPDPDR